MIEIAFALACVGSAPDEIAFTRGGDVHVVDAAGGSERALTADLDYDRPIVFSPDGATLVFWKHDAGWNLWAVDAAGGAEARNLTRQTGGDCRSAAFSPDGALVAFVRGNPQGVHAMAADGSGQRLVVAKGHRDQAPSFSPDGKSFAYMDLVSLGDNTVRTEVRVAAIDGSGDRLLASGSDPQWSPDGGSIVFVGHGPGGTDILSLAATGKGETAFVARSPETELDPRLSPDGRFVAYNALDTGGKTELRVAGTKDAVPRRIAAIDGRAEPPAWSPDGESLAFVSGGSLYVVRIAGTEPPRRIATGGVHWPAWRPRSPRAAGGGKR